MHQRIILIKAENKCAHYNNRECRPVLEENHMQYHTLGNHWMCCLLSLPLTDEWCSILRKQDIWYRCYHCAQETDKKQLSDFLRLLRKSVAELGQKSHILSLLLKQEHVEKSVWRVKYKVLNWSFLSFLFTFMPFYPFLGIFVDHK